MLIKAGLFPSEAAFGAPEAAGHGAGGFCAAASPALLSPPLPGPGGVEVQSHFTNGQQHHLLPDAAAEAAAEAAADAAAAPGIPQFGLTAPAAGSGDPGSGDAGEEDDDDGDDEGYSGAGSASAAGRDQAGGGGARQAGGNKAKK